MDLQDLRAFEDNTAVVVPGFQLVWKDTSVLQKLIGWVLKPFNPSYLKSYTTTLFPKVWFPSKASYEENVAASFTTLAHERVHLLDTMTQPIWFRVSYLFPQVLAVPLFVLGIVLAYLVGWWAVFAFLLALACLAPWPALWRVHWEQRGYAMSMAVQFWLTGDIPYARRDAIRQQFLGMGYFKMAWDEQKIDVWLDTTVRSIRNGTLATNDPVFGAVLQFMRDRGLTRS